MTIHPSAASPPRSDASSTEQTIESPQADDPGATTGAILDLLGDEYARELLAAIAEEPLCAQKLVERTDMSRVTVYRRLNRLEEIGFVESAITLDPDGHHYERKRLVVDAVTVSFDGDGITTAFRNVASGEGSEPNH